MKEISCEAIKKQEDYLNVTVLTQDELKVAFEQALKKLDMSLEIFTDKFPASQSKDYIYPAIDNWDWTSSFWTGMLWLAYEVTGDEKYRKTAEKNIDSFIKRINEKSHIDTHDLGFLYSLSCVASYKLTGNEEAKETAIKAADHLIGRYKEKGEFIQAWGNINDPKNYRLIIDCLMNLPLLYWATEVTGDAKYGTIARKHIITALSTTIRDDASTFHTYFFDPETGEPTKGVTAQGFSDSSCWARGQAWGIYGIPLSYAYTKMDEIKKPWECITNYFINRLPEDNVPYWDLVFTSGDEPRDTSAASIAVCGLMEMCKYLDEQKMIDTYSLASDAILKALIQKYTTKDLTESNGLLTDAMYSKPAGHKSECNIWGDYYYLEAIVRKMKQWKMYW